MKQCFLNPRGAKAVLFAILIFVLCAAPVAAQLEYCEAGGGCGEYISSVQINGMTYNSICDGYSYNPDTSVSLLSFDSLLITIELVNADMNDQVSVWVDWDLNAIFEGYEEIFTAVGPGPHSIAYEVPGLYYYHETNRIRIRLCHDHAPESCGVTDFGEVEDYAIILGSGYICGNADNSGSINIGDAVYLLNFIFRGGPAPYPYCVGDANGDMGINVGDVIYLIGYIFRGAPPPPHFCCS
ncbi:MAG: GEVED domain-containing protein [Candidatus Zixiibacteriota bacterium]